MNSYFVVGGAGFIGSHFCDRLLGEPGAEKVTVYDNFTSGRRWHLAAHESDQRFRIVEGDAKDLDLLTSSMAHHTVVIHLASNPDIARAMTEPTVDFVEGTLLTHNVVEAARRAGVLLVLYASGSGVYGDLGELEVGEDHGPLLPVSTYGASKLAGEAMLSAYSYMFGVRAIAFRFGNVVGPRQTHGVGFDFIRRLLKDGTRLEILGDGSQSKSYIHVHDVVTAVLGAADSDRTIWPAFNVATGDYVTVREIADLAVAALGLDASSVVYEFTGGDRGWKGDVPIVRLDTSRIRSIGWVCHLSTREALTASFSAMLDDAAAGRLT